jgi:hypothetical protein
MGKRGNRQEINGEKRRLDYKTRILNGPMARDKFIHPHACEPSRCLVTVTRLSSRAQKSQS